MADDRPCDVISNISTSNDATPLWLPQIAMALGTSIFALALIDELVLALLGKRAEPLAGEALRSE